MDQLVHAARSERGAHGVHDRAAGIDVADQLRLALACVRSLLQQDDLRLLQGTGGLLGQSRATAMLLAGADARLLLSMQASSLTRQPPPHGMHIPLRLDL